MFDVSKAFGTDPKKAAEGVNMYLNAEKTDYFIIRRIPGNKDYERELQKEYRRHEKAIKFGDREEAVDALSTKLLAKVLANTVLVGWENIAVKGKKLAYSIEAAQKLLIEFSDLRQAITEGAR